MKARDVIRRAGRNLRQAKVRTLLTALAISVGAFTIMLSLAAGEGARQYADNLIKSNVDPRSLFIVKDKTITGQGQAQSSLREYDASEGQQNGVTIKQLNKEDIEALSKRTDITDVRPIYNVNLKYLRIGDSDKRYKSEANVYNPDVLSEQVSGSLPNLGEDIGANDVIVPESFATTLKLSPQQLLGKKVTLTIEKATPTSFDITTGQAVNETKDIVLTIRSVVKPPKLSFTPSEAIQIPISVASEIADFTTEGTPAYQKYFAVTAKAADSTTPEAAKTALEKAGFYAQTADDLQGFLFTIVNVITSIVAGFGVIALIASIFGIINTQYISVLERTSQIGLMKALGMRGRDVARLFRYEAAWIGFLGGIIGVTIAWILGTALNPTIAKALDLGEGTNLLIFNPVVAVGLVVLLIVIAIVAGFFPSRKAAKLDPIEALRTE